MDNIRFNHIDPKFERGNRDSDSLGRAGSQFEWDFEQDSSDFSRPDTVISAMPNPEWDTDYDDISRFSPPGSASMEGLDSDPTWRDSTARAVEPVQPRVEIVEDEYTEHAPSYSQQSSDRLVNIYQGRSAGQRVEAVRKALNEALERWWSYSDLPGLGVLRNGLLVLEAGNDLDESQRSLLMRTALHHGKGIHTVLRHQTDPDRTAFLFQEALLSSTSPLSLDLLTELRHGDQNGELWVPLLIESLTIDLVQMPEPSRSWLVHVVTQLQQNQPSPQRIQSVSQQQTEPLRVDHARTTDRSTLPRFWALRPAHWSASRIGTTLLALLLLLGAYLWQSQRTTASGWAVIPEGTYTISDPDNPNHGQEVQLDAFVIEHTEVTNWQYRRCHESGVCSQPAYNYSETYSNYFMNPDFDSYPVVHITWADANAYCQWIGRHLPSVEEWEVAASIAPATQRRYTYPWGDRFQPELVNSLSSGVRDTQPVGLYHPAGDSSFGAWDMAGNVAEWTETSPDGMANHALVKGGSYRDDADGLQVSAYEVVPHAGAAPWLGFRCAKRLVREDE